MKSLILINSKQFSYHKRVADDFLYTLREIKSDDIKAQVFDMGRDIPLHEMFGEIKNHTPDCIFTFDLAGFELLTSNQTLSLNSLSVMCYNILFKSSGSYKDKLKLRQNLSMFTYFSSRDDIEFDERLKEMIPNPGRMCEYDYVDESDCVREQNRTNLAQWIKTLKMPE